MNFFEAMEELKKGNAVTIDLPTHKDIYLKRAGDRVFRYSFSGKLFTDRQYCVDYSDIVLDWKVVKQC